MSKYDDSKLRAIFAKANGLCHLCGKPIAFSNYGAHGARGGWEVDHSIPRSEGGTDHLNNLYPAHTSCNRSKQACSNRIVRQDHGRTRAPLSAEALKRVKRDDAATGAFAGAIVGARFAGPAGLLIGAIVGAVAAYAVERKSV